MYPYCYSYVNFREVLSVEFWKFRGSSGDREVPGTVYLTKPEPKFDITVCFSDNFTVTVFEHSRIQVYRSTVDRPWPVIKT